LNAFGVDPWSLAGAKHEIAGRNDDDQLDGDRIGDFSGERVLQHARFSVAFQKCEID
jgi:hypothetical protein